MMDIVSCLVKFEPQNYHLILLVGIGAVGKREIDNALRAINRSMGKHVPNRQDMCPDCPSTPAITDLFNKSSLKGVCNTLMGDYGVVGGGQIALRFPGDNTGGDFPDPSTSTLLFYSIHS
jgi:hypothetical protein